MNDSCAGGAQNMYILYPRRFLPKCLKTYEKLWKHQKCSKKYSEVLYKNRSYSLRSFEMFHTGYFAILWIQETGEDFSFHGI